MKRVRDLFRIVPGHGYELCNLSEVPNGIPFVSRTGENNGISAYVEKTEDDPTPAGCITVALGGSVLSTFLQTTPCYESFHIAILHPLAPMTDIEKLWYAAAIRAHRFRYNYGRQANKELPTLRIPEPPRWAKTATIPDLSSTAAALKTVSQAFERHLAKGHRSLPVELKRIRDLFHIVPGHDYELCNLTEVEGGIPLVSRTAENNGISAYVERTEDSPTSAGCITVALGGSVLSTFFQPVACYEGRDVATLHPIQPMTDAEKLWYATAIRAHRFRYSYGRQANKELPNLLIPICPAWVNDVTVPVGK